MSVLFASSTNPSVSSGVSKSASLSPVISYFICNMPYLFPVTATAADVFSFVNLITAGSIKTFGDDIKATLILLSGYP